MVVSVDALGASYTAVAKHTQGTRYYGADSDVPATFMDAGTATLVGTPLDVADAVASTPEQDDFEGETGPGGAVWTAL